MLSLSNIFNWWRFRLLMKKYMVENKSHLLFSGLLILVVMLLIAVITAMSYKDTGNPDTHVMPESGVMLLAFVLCGFFVASDSFSQLVRKSDAISMLTTPATVYEQLTIRWIMVVPVFTFWALVCAFAADIIKYGVCNYIFAEDMNLIPWMTIFDLGNPTSLENLYTAFLMYLFGQSFYLLGAVVWPRHSFIKTTIAVAVILFVYGSVMGLINESYSHNSDMEYYGSKQGFILYWPVQILLWLGIIINYYLTAKRLREYDAQGK